MDKYDMDHRRMMEQSKNEIKIAKINEHILFKLNEAVICNKSLIAEVRECRKNLIAIEGIICLLIVVIIIGKLI